VGGQHPRVTDTDRDLVRQLHSEGLGRNEIARRIGRSGRTVSNLAAQMNLEFEVTTAAKATEHRKAQLAEKRAILADALTDDALRLSAQVWEPGYVFNIGGKDNTYTQELVDELPAADKRQLIAAATNAAAQSLRLVPPETDQQGLAAVDAWLKGMMDG
jgi:DNA-binding CsgD family transcriptional regulator